MKKLGKELKKIIDSWSKDLELYKAQFIGLKPTEDIAEKILKDTGVHEVVFWHYDGFSTLQGHDLSDIDLNDEEYKTDFVISDNWKIADESDGLIYQSDFDFIYLDIQLINKLES